MVQFAWSASLSPLSYRLEKDTMAWVTASLKDADELDHAKDASDDHPRKQRGSEPNAALSTVTSLPPHEEEKQSTLSPETKCSQQKLTN